MGSVCKRGHVNPRRYAAGQCAECQILRKAKHVKLRKYFERYTHATVETLESVLDTKRLTRVINRSGLNLKLVNGVYWLCQNKSC